jgi:hypothetical protein
MGVAIRLCAGLKVIAKVRARVVMASSRQRRSKAKELYFSRGRRIVGASKKSLAENLTQRTSRQRFYPPTHHDALGIARVLYPSPVLP